MDDLKPSSLLGYKLGPPAKDYYIGPVIPGEGQPPISIERFIFDIVEYMFECIVNHNNQVLDNVFGSIVLLTETLYMNTASDEASSIDITAIDLTNQKDKIFSHHLQWVNWSLSNIDANLRLDTDNTYTKYILPFNNI